MNPDFVFEPAGEGCFTMRGELSFNTVPKVSASVGDRLWKTDSVILDLDGITRTDSAGLALLIEWIRSARRRNRKIVFRNIPEQMMVMAKVVGLDSLLPTDEPYKPG